MPAVIVRAKPVGKERPFKQPWCGKDNFSLAEIIVLIFD